MTIERRFFKGGNVRSTKTGKPGIEGYAATFNEEYVLWDDPSYRVVETIKPGAFSRVIKEKQDVRCLFNHEPDNLLGRTTASTLNLMQDKSGLHYDCDVPETQLGKDVRTLVDRGDLTGCSFAFTVGKQAWSEETDKAGRVTRHREIEEIENLFDVGPVTYPAYEGTSVSARSMFPQGVPEEIRSHVPELPKEELVVPPAPAARDTEPDGDECNCDCEACSRCSMRAKVENSETRSVEDQLSELRAEMKKMNELLNAVGGVVAALVPEKKSEGTDRKIDPVMAVFVAMDQVMSFEQARARTETLKLTL